MGVGEIVMCDWKWFLKEGEGKRRREEVNGNERVGERRRRNEQG